MTQEITIKVYESIDCIKIIINEERNGYTFKTPKGFGGKHYYSFCNHIDDAFCEQYPLLAEEIKNNN